MKLDDFLPMARLLASRIAWLPADEDDLVQVGMIELWKALEKTPEIQKPKTFAWVVLRRRMKDFYSHAERNRPPDLPIPPDLSSPAPESDILDALFLASYLDALESACGERSRWVAQNLIDPGPGIGRWLTEDAAARGKADRELKISHTKLWHMLGVSKPAWFRIIDEIRAFSLPWLDAQGIDTRGLTWSRAP